MPMNEVPLVSVIVPCHNYAHFLPETLDSLRAQMLENWECLVVDDGSTDNTREIAAHYAQKDARIRLIWQPNQGPAAARNNGIRQSRGRFIQFLDADDLLEKRKLERQSAFLLQNVRVDIVCGDGLIFTTPQNEAQNSGLNPLNVQGRWHWNPASSPEGAFSLVRGNLLAINATLTRREVFEDVGVFDESLWTLEDWDLWLRCVAAHKQFAFLEEEESHCLVRAHPISLSRSNTRRMCRAFMTVRQKISTMPLPMPLLRLNRDLWLDAEAGLGIEEARQEGLWAGRRRLFSVWCRSHNPKWLLFMLALPLVVDSRTQRWVRQARRVLRI